MRLPSLAAACAVLATSPAWAQDYPVVDTGQSHCYDDNDVIPCPAPGQPFYGQDAQHRRHPAQYRDNGDGTVSDLVTGLMWEKGYHTVSWPQTAADAAATHTGGHDDWRVPTIKELYSLINFNGATGSAAPWITGAPADARPYLDTSAFAFEYPARGRFIDAQYVSSTAYTGITMGRDRSFFGVNFADGRIKSYPQDGGPGRRQWYARYVRGNPAYGRNDFADNGDGTVTDRATGLTWMRDDSGSFAASLNWTASRDGRLNWEESLRFCQTLTLAGHDDWRLPHAKELQSIVDYTRSPQATDSAAIDPVFRITAIRDDAGKRNWPFFWTGTTHLDGPRPGKFAAYLAFGEAQGYLPQFRRPMMGGMGFGPPPQGFGGPPSRFASPQQAGGQTEQLGPLLDVHGAGAQRSSPKSGDESRLPKGHGPQGDVLRIYNYARCVRG